MSDSNRPTRPSLMTQLGNLVRGDRRRERRTRVSAEFSAKLSDRPPARVDDTGSFKVNAVEDSKEFIAAAQRSAESARMDRLEYLKCERDLYRDEATHLRAIIETSPGTSQREKVLLDENKRLREERRQREGR